MPAAEPSAAPPDAAAEAEGLRWYHTIDLGHGRLTPGYFDTRSVIDRVPLPDDLRGRTCLDIGSWDGFWAFEMERRGAAAVTAIDVADPSEWDWPATAAPAAAEELRSFKSGDRAFWLAREALGSSVERRNVNIYDLDPDEHGTFDVVFIGSLLLHLRDPIRALERARSVTRGQLVLVETVDAGLSFTRRRSGAGRLDQLDRPWWWTPNVAGLQEMARRAGFRVESTTGLIYIRLGAAHPRVAWRTCNPLSSAGREALVQKLRGLPHVAILATPAP